MIIFEILITAALIYLGIGGVIAMIGLAIFAGSINTWRNGFAVVMACLSMMVAYPWLLRDEYRKQEREAQIKMARKVNKRDNDEIT